MTAWQLLQGLAMASVTPEDYILLIEQQRTALTFSLDWLWQECDAPTGSAGGSFPTVDLIGWSKPKTDNDSQMSGKAVSIISCPYAKLS